MGKRIIVDPITRIEGHLRIEVEVEGGKVVDAWSSGQMFRGIEMILKGATLGMHTTLCSAPAVSALTFTPSPRCVRWMTLLKSKSPKTPG